MAMFSRIINIPTGAATVIPFSKPARGYTVRESIVLADGVTQNTPQGFYFVDKTVPSQPTREFPPPSTVNEPGDFPTAHVGDIDPSFHGPHGQILGNASNYVQGQGATAAQTLCTVATAGSGATAVEVTEYV